ncbi:hypothetical protein H1D32_07955 [Anaerobacillus sp. CMMVII]|uniref:FxLYD domain-containing protein n=1 Tax=Anaerobacillus sp. CMMVII TaxID=2755588 RepID=UPI0021B82C09|nr:FxLYD domain-containing protein [Anaerobacillus sp. CMMVII]MCT8137696.1 hypothetical protein [Anaerobacillus sp. CMMVII]
MLKKLIWLLPAVTFLLVIAVISSFYIYETNINNDVEALVKNGEVKALEGDLIGAKNNFEQALQKRPNHLAAVFNLEVIERGLHYEEQIETAADISEKQQFEERLQVLEELEKELGKEEGAFFEQFKEKLTLNSAKLILGSVDQRSSQQALEDLAGLIDKLSGFSSEASMNMVDLLKGEVIDLAINLGEKYMQKNQFTEAEVEFDRGLFYDPTNEKLLEYKENVKKDRTAYEQEEQKRLEKARARAAEEDNFNWTKAIKPLTVEFNYDEANGELHVWGEVKNIGTRPISEIDIHYTIFNEDGNGLKSSWAEVAPVLLLPNEIGFFEETLLISETVDHVEIVEKYWSVQ